MAMKGGFTLTKSPELEPYHYTHISAYSVEYKYTHFWRGLISSVGNTFRGYYVCPEMESKIIKKHNEIKFRDKPPKTAQSAEAVEYTDCISAEG